MWGSFIINATGAGEPGCVLPIFVRGDGNIWAENWV
jgi:hypothetical protein